MIKPTDMLKKLEPPVRPVPPVPSTRTVSQAIENMSFDEMLSQADTGEMNTHTPVILPDDLELDDLSRQALSDAADQAHAAGSKYALILLGEYNLLLDVETRRVEKNITGEADSIPRVISNIDAAVVAKHVDKSIADPAESAKNNIPETISRLQLIPGHEQGQWSQAVMSLIENQHHENVCHNTEITDMQTDANNGETDINSSSQQADIDINAAQWITESSDEEKDTNEKTTTGDQ